MEIDAGAGLLSCAFLARTFRVHRDYQAFAAGTKIRIGKPIFRATGSTQHSRNTGQALRKKPKKASCGHQWVLDLDG